MFSCKPTCFSALGRAANRYVFLQPNVQKAYVHSRANPFCNGFLCVRQHPAASGSFLWPTQPGSARQPPVGCRSGSAALARDPKEHTARSCYLKPHPGMLWPWHRLWKSHLGSISLCETWPQARAPLKGRSSAGPKRSSSFPQPLEVGCTWG